MKIIKRMPSLAKTRLFIDDCIYTYLEIVTLTGIQILYSMVLKIISMYFHIFLHHFAEFCLDLTTLHKFIDSQRDRRDVPIGVPLDLSTVAGMTCIGTYGENCKSDNVSKYRVLLVAFLLLWHGNLCH